MAEPIGVPEFSDKDIQGRTSLGSSLYDKQNYGRPQFAYPSAAGKSSVRDALVSAMIAASQGGTKAADMAKYGSQGASFLAGLTGAFGATTAEDIQAARAKAQAEAQLAQLESTPITADNFPGLAQKHPEIVGLPLGLVHRLSGVFGSSDRLERQMKLAAYRDSLRDDNEIIGKQEAVAIADAFGDSSLVERLTGVRRSTAVNILPKPVFDPRTGETVFANPRSIVNVPAGAMEVAKQKQAILNGLDTVREFQSQYSVLAEAGKTGVLSGNLELLKGFVSGGKFAPDATVYNNTRDGFLASLKGMTGENGVLSDQDTKRLSGLLPSIGMDAGAAAKQFSQIFDLLNKRTANFYKAYPWAQQEASGEETGLFRKKVFNEGKWKTGVWDKATKKFLRYE